MKHTVSASRKRNIPTLEEVFTVLKRLAPIDRLACLTIGAHFSRPGEIMAVQAKNLTLTPGSIATLILEKISRGKYLLGMRDLICVCVHNDLVEILRTMCRLVNPDDYLFSLNSAEPGKWSSVSRNIRKVARQLGLKSTPYEIVRYAFIKHACLQISSIEIAHLAMIDHRLDVQPAVQNHILIPSDVIPSVPEIQNALADRDRRRNLRRRRD